MASMHPAAGDTRGGTRHLLRAAVFMVTLVVLAAVFHRPLLDGFLANIYLNGTIILIFLFGAGFTFKALFDVLAEHRAVARAIEVVRVGRRNEQPVRQINEVLLAPGKSQVHGFLHTVYRTVRQTDSSGTLPYLLDSINARGEDRRALVRYLTGALVLLGLIGTFYGLLLTIGGVRDVIGSISAEGDTVSVLTGLKERLAAPLGGMSLAFSTSLFGLLTSLALAFLELQLFHAQNDLHARLEQLVVTELVPLWQPAAAPVGGAAAGGEAGWRYVSGLLATTAERLEKVSRDMAVPSDTGAAAAAQSVSEQIAIMNQRLESLRGTLDRLESDRTTQLRDELRLLARVLGQDRDFDDRGMTPFDASQS